MKILTENIISSTDIIKNYKNCREKTKKHGETIIFKNNVPDMVLIDVRRYEEMKEIIDEIEHIEIYNMIQERNKNDDGTRYSLSELKEMLEKQKRS